MNCCCGAGVDPLAVDFRLGSVSLLYADLRWRSVKRTHIGIDMVRRLLGLRTLLHQASNELDERLYTKKVVGIVDVESL